MSTTLTGEVSRRIRRDRRFRAALEQRYASPAWRASGLCLPLDPEMFFPNAADDPAPALMICQNCPVRAACLAAALDAGDCDGVWGATTPDERRPMRQVWVSARGH
ncbi:MAG TPA: WhiB family transcriptional regulator [Mycobacteriales bacterium]|nr:WhiB family transcriptional regulator [Mycobacteriales bacterium]